MRIEKTACVGAGLIGQGWATIFSSKGYEVVLQDRSEAILSESMKGVKASLMFLEKNDFLKRGDTEAALGRIKTTTDLGEAVSDVDYVQESVFDHYDLKKEVFSRMDKEAPEQTILASSASGLLMTEIQKVTSKPERCVLVHPILPVQLIPVVEVVGGEQTAQGTVKAACGFMEKLGKIPVALKREVPGYIVNRLQAALLREAIDLVDKGVASAEDVDKAFCKGIGLRDPVIGPLLRIHLAGDGIERFLENYSKSYSYRWQTMESWTDIPPTAARKIIQGVNEMEIVRTKPLAEIKSWRDDMLVKLIKTMQGE